MTYFSYMLGIKFRNTVTLIKSKIFDLRVFIAHLFGRRIFPRDITAIFEDFTLEEIADEIKRRELHYKEVTNYCSGERKKMFENAALFMRNIYIALKSIK